jgi:hypothetical protein
MHSRHHALAAIRSPSPRCTGLRSRPSSLPDVLHTWYDTTNYIMSARKMRQLKDLQYNGTPIDDLLASPGYDHDRWYTVRPQIAFQALEIGSDSFTQAKGQESSKPAAALLSASPSLEGLGILGQVDKTLMDTPAVVYALVEPLFYELSKIDSPLHCLPQKDAMVPAFNNSWAPTDGHATERTAGRANALRKDGGGSGGSGSGGGGSGSGGSGGSSSGSGGSGSGGSGSGGNISSGANATSTTGAGGARRPLIDCSMAEELPRPVRLCAGKNRSKLAQPVIIAGEGKTGTSSMATALAMLGLKVAHYDDLLQCCNLETEPTKHNPHGHCTTYPMGDLRTCNGISWSTANGYAPARDDLFALEARDYDSHDFCEFDQYDVYSDEPMPPMAPYIYAAYGAGTKVILTEVNASKWTATRAAWDQKTGASDVAPMGFAFSDSINAVQNDKHSPMNEINSYNRSHSANAMAYIASRALMECVAAPADVLRVNLEVEAQDPPALWAKLSAFLGLTTNGLQTQYFPMDKPGECKSW